MQTKLKVGVERDRPRGWLIRFWWNWTEIAYIVIGVRGLEATVEFPSDWHEHRMGWVRLGLGVVKIAVAFPWPWVVPDHYQCSGPRFGFQFFGDGLHLSWGKSKGTRNDPFTIISMPWAWRHQLHEVLGEPETHHYTYTLRNGEVQKRNATIKPERRVWTRTWWPLKRESRYIDIDFDEEVGERSGSWKGGVLGCSFDMQPGDRPVDALRRMERERTFT